MYALVLFKRFDPRSLQSFKDVLVHIYILLYKVIFFREQLHRQCAACVLRGARAHTLLVWSTLNRPHAVTRYNSAGSRTKARAHVWVFIFNSDMFPHQEARLPVVCGEGMARRRGVINGELPRIQHPASSLRRLSLQDHCAHEVLHAHLAVAIEVGLSDHLLALQSERGGGLM